jgi:hypothetical protein
MQSSQDWIGQFDQTYQHLLDPKSSGLKRGLIEGHCQRWQGFRIMFQLLLERQLNGHRIIETGTLRNPGNWKDGQSARLFTEFVDHYHGDVRSVDIDAAACQTARTAITSPRFTVTCSDSVAYLASLTDLASVNLFYLDSWDVKWENDNDSAEHHLREFQAIESHITPGTIVAIDDNSRFLVDQRRTGKGRRVVEYLAGKNCHPIYDRYQIIYQF